MFFASSVFCYFHYIYFCLFCTSVFWIRKKSSLNVESAAPETTLHSIRFKKKPEWVVREVIRLSSLMPNNGCRKIATVFNRLHTHKRDMTVSKSTVYNIMLQHKHAIYLLRKQIKQRKPTLFPKNILWSIDLTTITNENKKQHMVFGVIDNGTRVCLLLQHIADKSSVTLLHCLLDIIEAYGKPKKIRMDNEVMFKSRLFRFGLWILNIKPQYTEVACPWMNGRVERFFETLKQHVRKVIISEQTLEQRLIEFRYWYNHVRTHNNLKDRTPAETWSKTQHNQRGEAVYVSLWNGVLNGFYIPPD